MCPHDLASRGCIDRGFARICGPRESKLPKYPRAPRVFFTLGRGKAQSVNQIESLSFGHTVQSLISLSSAPSMPSHLGRLPDAHYPSALPHPPALFTTILPLLPECLRPRAPHGLSLPRLNTNLTSHTPTFVSLFRICRLSSFGALPPLDRLRVMLGNPPSSLLVKHMAIWLSEAPALCGHRLYPT